MFLRVGLPTELVLQLLNRRFLREGDVVEQLNDQRPFDPAVVDAILQDVAGRRGREGEGAETPVDILHMAHIGGKVGRLDRSPNAYGGVVAAGERKSVV